MANLDGRVGGCSTLIIQSLTSIFDFDVNKWCTHDLNDDGLPKAPLENESKKIPIIIIVKTHNIEMPSS